MNLGSPACIERTLLSGLPPSPDPLILNTLILENQGTDMKSIWILPLVVALSRREEVGASGLVWELRDTECRVEFISHFEALVLSPLVALRWII